MRPALWILAGCPAAERVACEEMCDQLVLECDFAAFPDLGSCLEGCSYEAGGASLGAYDLCLYKAGCDPFAVLDCARAHGLSP